MQLNVQEIKNFKKQPRLKSIKSHKFSLLIKSLKKLDNFLFKIKEDK